MGIAVHVDVTSTRAAAATTTKKTTTAKAPAKKAAPASNGATKTAAAKKAAPAKKATASASADEAESTTDAVAEVGPDGKKLLPDLPDEQFEKDVKADPSIEEDEKEASFVVSDADDTGEPEQQVMVAGATADPVKDYLKQIGKVPLLNAEMEVELAKRIEAGLFSEAVCSRRRSSPRAASSSRRCSRSSSGSPRTAAAPRITCSRPTCAWSCRWPSATPAAACSSST